jgi:putative transposase
MKRTHRSYSELGLQLRRKPPKRRVKAKLREDRCEATASTKPGRWTSYTTSSPPAARSGC